MKYNGKHFPVIFLNFCLGFGVWGIQNIESSFKNIHHHANDLMIAE